MGRVQNEQRKQEYYATIVRETERLTRLVNNILDFSKMEAGKKKYQFIDINLNSVVSSVLNTYSYHLQSEGFTPLVTLEPQLPSIRADAESVTEAIVNVLDNAVKYSGAEKYLRVCTGVSDGFAFVEVEDHGIGIAPEHQQRVFETFYRVSSGLAHNTRGSGLGLAIVKHIMLAHNGKSTVHSAAGKGSTFRLLFPLTSEDSSPEAAAR
jgi:two-component system phosphate regulon sensor histidine kinase PhoR